VQDALALLGLRETSRLIAGLLLRRAFASSESPAMYEFWDASARIAMIAAYLARELAVARLDEAHTFALFRDCGVPVLLARYPETVAGVKDSSGDLANTRAMLDRFAAQGFAVFAGNEMFLLATMRGGGAGSISAIANVNPAAIAELARDWQRPDADARQAQVDRVRKALAPFPMLPALKATVAHFSRDDDWARPRPPLMALSDTERARCMTALADIGFTMPGLA